VSGGDSFAIAALLSALAEQFDLELEAQQVGDHPLLAKLARVIARQ
jgi:acyl carrier protein